MNSRQTESEFLHTYDPTLYDRPNCTVDTAIFTVRNAGLYVLTVKRVEHPFINMWSLVGGFIDIKDDSDLEATARRKLKEKTGVETPYLEQYGTVGNAVRDPRGWSITTVYFALIPSENIRLVSQEGDEIIKWSHIEGSGIREQLAFDHAELLAGCLQRLRDKVLYTTLPVHLMPSTFTLGELQKVYELILDRKLEHKSFRRRMLGADILEETHEFRRESKRPAQLYRLQKQLSTHLFLRNFEGPASRD